MRFTDDRLMTSYIRPLLFSVLLTLMSCDAGPGQSPPAMDPPPVPTEDPPTAPEISLERPIDDLSGDTGQEPTAFSLSSYFTANDEAGNFSFSATVSGDAVSVSISDGVLSVSYMLAGTAQVAISATGAGSSAATDTFAVVVTDPFPAGAAEGEADFVPITPGTEWVYEYSVSPPQCSSIQVSRRGTLTLSFVSETGTRGVRTVIGEVRAEYEETESDGRSGESTTTDVTYTEPFVAEETAEGVLLSGPGLERLSLAIVGRRLDRYHPASESSVRIRISVPQSIVLRPGRPPAIEGSGGSCGAYPQTYLNPHD